MSRSRFVLACAAAAALSGCYTTTVRSGLQAAPKPTVEYDEKWHSGLIVGIAELSGPYALTEACPQGWAEIKTETSFVNGFVELVTSGIYNPQSVTIVCAGAPGGQAPAAPSPAPQVAAPAAGEAPPAAPPAGPATTAPQPGKPVYAPPPNPPQ